ncbi:MAG: FGGY family carbohydrate kinase, partial [Nitrososphaerota archaeon]
MDMVKEYLLGIDIGTLGSKGVIINADAEVIAQKFIEHDIKVLRPGWVEQDPEVFWNDFKTLTKLLINDSKINPSNIVGVGISGLVPDVVPIDEFGKPIRNCIIYMDRRAVREAEWVKERIGHEKIYMRSGNAIDPYFAGYKCLWFKFNEPENYKKTWRILDGSKYVVFKLTEKDVLDSSTGPLFAPFFNLLNREWDKEILNELNFEAEKLPDIASPIEIIGEVTAEASKETGLNEGTKVIAGGPDYQFSAYSVGISSLGDTMIMYGTTGLLGLTLDKPLFDPRLVNSIYIVPNMYMSFGGMSTIGALVRWFRDEFGFVEREAERLTGVSAYSLLDREAEKVPP